MRGLSNSIPLASSNNTSQENTSTNTGVVVSGGGSFMPNNMKFVNAIYDIEDKCVYLSWEEPEDTIINGQLLSSISGIKIVRKVDSPSVSINDGEIIADISARDFEKYKKQSFVDNFIEFENGKIYHYHFYPYNSSGIINDSYKNETYVEIKDYYLYGFRLDQSESDPSKMVTYIEDNKNFAPAYMDFDKDEFNYGSWKNAWFIKNLKPVLLKYDGTVGQYLDPDDYSKQLDGTPSNFDDVTYLGNVMVGIPKVYYKIVADSFESNECYIYFSNKKLDDDFVCWSHINSLGNEIDYCYMSADCCTTTSKTLEDGTTKSVQTCCKSENLNISKSDLVGSSLNVDTISGQSHVIWSNAVWSDHVLITLLLLLISRSTNSQKSFGSGVVDFNIDTIDNRKMLSKYNKGLFYGKKDHRSTVKVFGIERFYGSFPRYLSGILSQFSGYSGNIMVKMTYGSQDGSTVEGYNKTGDGYLQALAAGYLPTNADIDYIDTEYTGYEQMKNIFYITKMNLTKYGLIPRSNITWNGNSVSSTDYNNRAMTVGANDKYFCDYAFSHKPSSSVSAKVIKPIVGGFVLQNGGTVNVSYENPGSSCGMFFMDIDCETELDSWDTNFMIACKP